MSLLNSNVHDKYFVSIFITTIILFEYILFDLNMKCFLCLKTSCNMLKLTFKQVLKLIYNYGGEYMSREFQEYLKNASYFNNLVLKPLKEMKL